MHRWLKCDKVLNEYTHQSRKLTDPKETDLLHIPDLILKLYILMSFLYKLLPLRQAKWYRSCMSNGIDNQKIQKLLQH